MRTQNSAQRPPRLPTILGLAAILLWSFTIPLARSVSESLGPITSGMWVYLPAGVVLTGIWLWGKKGGSRIKKFPLHYLIGCGSLFVVYTFSLFLALDLAQNRLQSVAVGLINYLWPALTLLLSMPLLGFRGGPGIVPGTLLALSGVFLVLQTGEGFRLASIWANFSRNPAAPALGALAAVSWAFYSNLSRRWSRTDGGGAVPLFFLATGMAFCLLRWLHPEPGTWTLGVIIRLVSLSLVTAMGYLFWDIAMRRGNMVLVVAASYLTPLLSTLTSIIVLGVHPRRTMWIGCLSLIAGSLLCWRSIRPNPAPAAARTKSASPT